MTVATEWVEDHFVAGDVVLDFANTVYRRWPRMGSDLFTNAESLSSWLERAGLLPHSNGVLPPAGEETLEEARALRATLWLVFDAQRERRSIPPDAFSALLDVARRLGEHVTVDADGDMTARDPQSAIGALALGAISLVLDPPQQGVRACDACGWFFVDSSRGRRRRWCSMKTCGNQAKVDRYRAARA
ncbi:ABATE domain-containing protein [Microbacterium sp.]|uniref:CGNR zinc finger domain-containing protein n=1 Tax=Microbacterium sp. TaxID=51671 RepID=UPI0028112972|nr:ABATE domain-containing protein [Microbacterium sp.]